MTPNAERQLIAEIYAAGLQPQRWPSVMSLLASAVGEVKTHIFGYDDSLSLSLLTATSGYDPAFLRSFDEHYALTNAWAPGFVSSPRRTALTLNEMLAEPELKKTEWYNDWIGPQESICRGAGVILFQEPGRSLLFGGNIREKDGDTVEPLWFDLVNRIAPAMRLAMEVARQVAGLTLENMLLRQGLDASRTAVLILNADHRVLHTNPAAEIMLQHGNVLRVDHLGKLVTVSQTAGGRTLAKGLSRVFISGRGSEAFPLADGVSARLLPVDTSVVPIAPFGPLWRDFGTVAMMLVQHAATDGLANRLAKLGLTSAEAQIALSLADGQTIAEIAEARRASIHTVRNQVKSALWKTGSRRQAELVALVERLRRT